MGVLSSPTVLIMVQYQRTINISVAAAQTPGQSAVHLRLWRLIDQKQTDAPIDFHNVMSAGRCKDNTPHILWRSSRIILGIKEWGGKKTTFNCKSSLLWSEAPWNLSLNLRFMSFNTSDMNKRHFRSSAGAERRQQRSRDRPNVCSPSDIILARWQMSMMLLIKAALMYRFLISPSTSTSGVLCCTCICPLDGPREHF